MQLIVMIISLAMEAGALTAYDCQHQEAAYQAVDLMRPAACPDPEKDYEPARPQRLQLLQVDSRMPVKAYRCQATMSKRCLLYTSDAADE